MVEGPFTHKIESPHFETQEFVLNEYTYTVKFANMVQESQILLVIKPSPKWISNKLWVKLASKFLIIKSKTNYDVELEA